MLISRARLDMSRSLFLVLSSLLFASLSSADQPLATTEVAKVVPPTALSSAVFGGPVAVWGDTMVVGAPQDDLYEEDSGSVYVYQRSAGGADRWSLVANIQGSGVRLGTHFGTSVDIWEDTIVIGAIDYHGADSQSGAVWVFERNLGGADSWGEVRRITSANVSSGDDFGSRVGISRDTIVVSAIYDWEGGEDSGSVYVFERHHGGVNHWGEVTKLVASDGLQFHYFGRGLAIDGDTVVIGATGHPGGASFAGATYIFERNYGGSAESWGEMKKLYGHYPNDFTDFRFSVDISGDTIIVGNPTANGLALRSGKAEIFERNRGGADNWGRVAELLPDEWATEQQFGISVAIDGEVAIAGQIFDDRQQHHAGSISVFERNIGGPDAWGRAVTVQPTGIAVHDHFGQGVDVHGTTIIVGAKGDDTLADESGAVYVFAHTGDRWPQSTQINASDAAIEDLFGGALALSGDTLLVGSPAKDSTTGAAYLYSRNRNGKDAWGEIKKLVPSDAASGDAVGYSVAVGGSIAAVGAYLDTEPYTWSGSVTLFERNAGGAENWGEELKLVPADPSVWKFFGCSVEISGDTLVVGARGDDTLAYNSGAAYVFQRHLGGPENWGQVAKLLADDGSTDDDFGQQVAIGGDTIVVGAHLTTASNRGSAYIFRRNSGGANAWGQVAELTASDGASDDHFGWAAAASNETVVVGSRYAGPNRRGAAYVFDRNQGGADNWGEVVKLLAADPEPYDWFGHEVAIHGDLIAISAYGDDDGGEDSGSVYLFRRNEGGANAWGQVAKINASDPGVQDYFGKDVALSTRHLAVGAHKTDEPENSGSVYLFEMNRSIADLAITVTDGVEVVTGGGLQQYSIEVSNAGPTDVNQALVKGTSFSSMIDLPLVTWTCVSAEGSGLGTSCPISGNGDDFVDGVKANLETDQSVVFTVAVPILATQALPSVVKVSVDVTPPMGTHDPNSMDNSATDTNTVREVDRGDAPDPTYPTRASSDGAYHGIIEGFHLGDLIDADFEGKPKDSADGDDASELDDEDGVQFSTVALPGSSMTTVVSASAAGLLDAWIDFNADGDWVDQGEQVYAAQPLAPGSNELSVLIPATAHSGATFARFRFSSTGGLDPSGRAEDGEVEDYLLVIGSFAGEAIFSDGFESGSTEMWSAAND